MLEICILFKKYCDNLGNATWRPLWNKFLNKIVPFDVAFDAACRKDPPQKPFGLMEKILIAIITAFVSVAATIFFTKIL
jgi:hypothetical protein